MIKIFDPQTWEHVGRLDVKLQDGTKVQYLNELEIIAEQDSAPPGISNYAFGNQFFTSNIHMIDLRTGTVVKTWDFSFLTRH